MKLSELRARIDRLEKRKLELEGIRATHFLKRPPEWQGKAEELKTELDAVCGELIELQRWLRGHWYEDDIGAGGGSLDRPLAAA